jgi:hypothetical protein
MYTAEGEMMPHYKPTANKIINNEKYISSFEEKMV